MANPNYPNKSIAVIATMLVATCSYAQHNLYRGDSFLESTYLVGVEQDSYTSKKARELRSDGYETASGEEVDVGAWYSPKWTDTHITWMTRVAPNFAFLWGIGTGERAEKYTIDPSLRLGIQYQKSITKSSAIFFSASTYIGGALSEKTCMADYGQIGGIQRVNCRLAASLLPPEETLPYLVQAKPIDVWSIRYIFQF